MADTQANLVPCPYVVGSTFRLRVTPLSGYPFEAQVTVVETYTPFTISPVMRVSLNCIKMDQEHSSACLPSELVLKVYDRRFAHSLREYFDVRPLTYETEALYTQYISSGRAPQGSDAISDEIDNFESFEACPPDLLEHFIASRISPYAESERAVYQRLESLQGRDIPIFYGSTEFMDESSVPGLSLSVPGVLLELVEGTSLEHINPGLIDIDTTLRSALRIVDTCGDLGILNHDVRLGNFIVRPNGSVAMIDFAQSRLRREDEGDLTWKRMKWSQDEEGCIGFAGMRKFGWPYVRSFKYLPPPENEDS